MLRNRTFFWFSTENYHDVQTRNASVTMPTTLERSGDFSQTTNAAGQMVVVYDPLTGQPFAGNRIPAGRINPTAAAMLQYLPLADVERSNGSTNYTRTSLIKNQLQQLYSAKVSHKLTETNTITGFYLYNKTDEPDANYFGSADQSEPTRFADPLDYILVRRPKILAINDTWVMSDSSVLGLRFGMTRFPDNNTLHLGFGLGLRSRLRLLDRPVDRLRRRRRRQLHDPTGAERRDGGTQRLADADRQHQRRLADRFAAAHDAGLGGALEERDAQGGRALAQRRQLVGRRAGGLQVAVLAPDEFLGRQPAHALDEAAFDLAAIDERRERVADVVQDVGAQQPVLPGEAVDLDLADRGAVGEVVERRALPRLPVEV